jgi:ketosteroid isomerase-like protein
MATCTRLKRSNIATFNHYHNLLVIRDGLIVEGREYMDTKAKRRKPSAEARTTQVPSPAFA